MSKVHRKSLLILLCIFSLLKMQSAFSMDTDSDHSDSEQELITFETIDEIKTLGLNQTLLILTGKYREHQAIPWWTSKYFNWLFKENGTESYNKVCQELEILNANQKFFTIAKKALNKVLEKRKKKEK